MAVDDMRTMQQRALIMLACLALVAAAGHATARSSSDPKVPAGRDPGGVAVAIIGNGLDYRRAEIASRLARDGEGELIGWDLVDDDARPFAASGGDEVIASLVLAEGQVARLAVVRAGSGRQDHIAMALRLTGQTPARIALILADPGRPLDRAHLSAAARQLPHLLIVVPARHVASDAAAPGVSGGLVVVGGTTHPGADAVVASGAANELAPTAPPSLEPDDRAAARVVALAVRLAASEPTIDGATLRARVLSHAATDAAGPPLISAIDRSKWRE